MLYDTLNDGRFKLANPITKKGEHCFFSFIKLQNVFILQLFYYHFLLFQNFIAVFFLELIHESIYSVHLILQFMNLNKSIFPRVYGLVCFLEMLKYWLKYDISDV